MSRGSFDNIYELESLFVEKLSEKYSLNKKDLKKAFMRFDHDGNGLLDLSELGAAIRVFVNGVNDNQVEQLMSAYDMNGDGKVSYEELLHYLTTREATRAAKATPRTNLARMKEYEDDRENRRGKSVANVAPSIERGLLKLNLNNNNNNNSLKNGRKELQNNGHPALEDEYYNSDGSDHNNNDTDYDDEYESASTNSQASSAVPSSVVSSSTAASYLDVSDPHQVLYRPHHLQYITCIV